MGWLLAGIVVVFAALGAAGLLSLGTLREARNELTQVKDLLTQVSDNPSTLLSHAGRDTATSSLTRAASLSRHAAALISSSKPLAFLGLFPLLHTQRSGMISLASDAAIASVAARDLLENVDSLARSSPITGAQVPLSRLGDLEKQVDADSRLMQSLISSSSWLLPPLHDARYKFNDTASKVGSRLASGAHDLGAARTFMGARGPRNYLIVGENNSEMRDQGMPLSYSTVSFTSGKFTTTSAAFTGNIEPTQPVDVPMSPGASKVFGGLDPTSLWQNANSTADFPWSATAMSAMYQQVTGVHIDGVIAVDVAALSRILAVTGPVSVPGISTQVTSSNVADVLLNQLYQQSPSPEQQGRRDEVASAASTILHTLESGGVADVVDLGDALAKSAAGGHLMLWSADPAEEKVFVNTGLGGPVANADPHTTFHIAVENATATKLDYFVEPSITMSLHITPQGDAVVDLSILVANKAPADQQASYQLGPDNVNSFAPGEYVARVYFWGPADGTQADSVSESHLRLSQSAIKVEPGQTGTVTFRTIVPGLVRNGALHLHLVPQARLTGQPVTVSIAAPGWRFKSGTAHEALTLDSTTNLEWQLARQ